MEFKVGSAGPCTLWAVGVYNDFGIGGGDERGLICIRNHQLYSNTFGRMWRRDFAAQNALHRHKKQMTQLRVSSISLIMSAYSLTTPPPPSPSRGSVQHCYRQVKQPQPHCQLPLPHFVTLPSGFTLWYFRPINVHIPMFCPYFNPGVSVPSRADHDARGISQSWDVHPPTEIGSHLSMGFPYSSVKNLSAAQETQVQSLGQEDPLENRMTTHSSILAWRIPWTEEPGGLQSLGLQRVRRDWATNTFKPVAPTLTTFSICTLVCWSTLEGRKAWKQWREERGWEVHIKHRSHRNLNTDHLTHGTVF